MSRAYTPEVIERYKQNIPIAEAEIARLERDLLPRSTKSRRAPEIEARIAECRREIDQMKHAIAYAKKKERKEKGAAAQAR